MDEAPLGKKAFVLGDYTVCNHCGECVVLYGFAKVGGFLEYYFHDSRKSGANHFRLDYGIFAESVNDAY